MEWDFQEISQCSNSKDVILNDPGEDEEEFNS